MLSSREVSYTGPSVDDEGILEALPALVSEELVRRNGYVAFEGGFHFRGACTEPLWHSLRCAWEGDLAFHLLYSSVRPADIPFAEDCLGDQYLLRDSEVWSLAAETGHFENTGLPLSRFISEIEEAPVEFLGLEPFLEFKRLGNTLAPGQLLVAYPPFCSKEAERGVHLGAVSSLENRTYLAEFAEQIGCLKPGSKFSIKVVE